jgi:hypothetical protein
MTRFIVTVLTTALFAFATLHPAHAGGIDKKTRKAFISEIESHYDGDVWALKEPIGSSVLEENGKKVETWNPRQNNGMRIGFGVQIETSGFPVDVRFEDGKLVGVATNASGGVSLD